MERDEFGALVVVSWNLEIRQILQLDEGKNSTKGFGSRWSIPEQALLVPVARVGMR